MAKLSMLVGSTSQTVNIFIQDSTLTTGAGKTGLVFNTASLIAYYALPKAAPVAITLATLASATAAYSSGGFFELDATHTPGLYRFDIPNAALASGRFSTIMLSGATGMAPVLLEIELTGWDNQDAVHGGLTCLPNTAVSTNASLLTSGTGTDQLSVTSGRIDAGKILGTAISTPATAGILDVNIKNISNAAVSATSAQLGVNVVNWNNTVVATPATAGIPDVNVKNMNNVSASAITTIKAVQGLTTADTISTVTNQLTAAAIATGIWQDTTAGDFTVASSIGKSLYTSGNAPGAASGIALVGSNMGTVSSVTGAVGSVTGAVGSVTGAVGSVTGNVGGSVASVVGLTASNLDATISSRMATYSQPTGFLAATFPTGTIANTTNIAAGTITTTTNLTNAPTAGDFTSTMKTSLNSATPAVTVSDKTGFSLTAAYDAAKTAAQASDIPTANITAIKAKTDSLAFTVAGQVDCNIQYVNDTQVNGNGSAGTPWGP